MNTDALLEVFLSALIKLMVVVVPILLGLLTRALVNYLKEQESKLIKENRLEDLALLQEITAIAIQAAEQLFTNNEEKMRYACLELIRKANENDIPITQKDAHLLIEGSVKAVKLELLSLTPFPNELTPLTSYIEPAEPFDGPNSQ